VASLALAVAGVRAGGFAVERSGDFSERPKRRHHDDLVGQAALKAGL
jgi:hypothetical protein